MKKLPTYFCYFILVSIALIDYVIINWIIPSEFINKEIFSDKIINIILWNIFRNFDTRYIYTVTLSGILFLWFLVFFYLLKSIFENPIALLGPLIIACFLPLIFYINPITISEMLNLLLFTLGSRLIQKSKNFLLLILLFLGCLNDLLFSFIFFLWIFFNWSKKDLIKNLVFSFLFIAVIIFDYYQITHIFKFQPLELSTHNFLKNIYDIKFYFYFILIFGAFIPFLPIKTKDRFINSVHLFFVIYVLFVVVCMEGSEIKNYLVILPLITYTSFRKIFIQKI